MYTPIALFAVMAIASVLGAIALFTALPEDHPAKKDSPSVGGRLFGIDLRSLAFFRVALASMVISDILHRIPDIAAHYTDKGILPRADLITKFLGQWILSLHMWNGTSVGITLLFGFTIFCATCFLLGYRTKLFNFLCWLLVISLHGRNPMVLQAGDVLFRVLLFWALFLPLGARFSVDSALNSTAEEDPPPKRLLTIAGVAILIQTGLVYTFSAAMKTHAHWWPNGESVYFALSIDHFATPVAHWLLEYPLVTKYLTLGTFWLEWLGPFILFIPVFTGPIRIVMVLTFWGMHIGFGTTLLIGMFVFVSSSSWIPYIPSHFWDRIGYAWEKRRSSAIQIFYDGDCNFCAKGVRLLKTFLILPKAELLTGQSRDDIAALMSEENSWVVIDDDGKRHLGARALTELVRRSPLFWPLAIFMSLGPIQGLLNILYRIVASNRARFSFLTSPFQMRPLKWRPSFIGKLLATCFLLIVIAWNFGNLKAEKKHTPEPLLSAHKEMVKFKTFIKPLVYTIRIDQRWNMFAPYPLKSDGWFVIDAKLRNKRHLNLFSKRFLDTDEAVQFEKPEMVSAMYPNQRWRKYLMNLWSKKYKKHRLYFGRYMCRWWNRLEYEDKVAALTEECFEKADDGLWDSAFEEGYSWSAYSDYRADAEDAEKKCKRKSRSTLRKQQLISFKIYYMKESSKLPKGGLESPDYKVTTRPVKKVEIWNHWCFKKKGEDGKVPDKKKKKPNEKAKTRAKSRT